MSRVAHAYSAFGLTVHSDVELTGLPPPGRGQGSVVVRVAPPTESTRPRASAPAFAAGMEDMWRSPDGWLFRYQKPGDDESWTMRVGAAGGVIGVERTAGIALRDVLQVVQSVGLASALQLQGVLLLHGCAVEVEGRAVLVLGAAGTGKSTTAAAFVREGFRLISDDIAAIEPSAEALLVQPGPTRLRIAPQSALALGWDPDELPCVFDTDLLGDKREIELSVDNGWFCAEPREVATIFVLAARTSGRAARLSRVEPARALALLRANGYRDAVLDRSQQAERFPLLARLAGEVPVHAVEAPDDLGLVPRLVDTLVGRAHP